jgi:hypothetical protein
MDQGLLRIVIRKRARAVGIAPLNLCFVKQTKRDVCYVAKAEPAMVLSRKCSGAYMQWQSSSKQQRRS